MRGKRNLSIEIFRCGLMLGVCCVHTLYAGLSIHEPFSILNWLYGLATASVDGFVFISGYYGIRFSWRKLLALYAVAVFYSAATGDPMEVIHGFWFLHAYAALMCIAPIINISGGGGLPFLALIFAYGWIANFAHLRSLHLPLANFLASHTWITLIGVYVAARIYRERELEKAIRMKWCVMVIPVLAALNGMPYAYLGGYNSPFCLGLAIAIFTVFKKIEINVERYTKLASFVAWIGPSLFPIYIIHQTPMGRAIVAQIGTLRACVPIPNVLFGLFFGVSVFLLCLLVDSFRRMIMKCFIKFCKSCNILDLSSSKVVC